MTGYVVRQLSDMARQPSGVKAVAFFAGAMGIGRMLSLARPRQAESPRQVNQVNHAQHSVCQEANRRRQTDI
jgi:hypothetical protein